MTAQECYEKIGGNYDEAMGRMMKDERIVKFVGMFLRDPSYEALVEAMDQGDVESAFKAAHTMKGVCANLALTKLFNSTVEVTEALRGGDYDTAKTLMPQLVLDYELTISGIQELIG